MIDRNRITGLIPHAGAMVLLNEVLEWDDTRIVCRTRSHLDASNPLRSADRLAAIHLAEYGAQAMAVHGGLLAERTSRSARAGMLISLRDLVLSIDRLDLLAAALIVTAVRLFGDDSGLVYEFTAQAEDATDGPIIGRGRIGIMTLAD